mgnify:CR=1 FL=1
MGIRISSADFCLECKSYFFFYNNICYLNCSDLNILTSNDLFGNSYEDFEWHRCLDVICIDCSDNFTICNECAPLFHLNQTTSRCINVPTDIFTKSIDFTNSNVFSKTLDFSFFKAFYLFKWFFKNIRFFLFKWIFKFYCFYRFSQIFKIILFHFVE